MTLDIELDWSRQERLGFPEIIYGEFKTVEQVVEIVKLHTEKRKNLFVTRLSHEKVGDGIGGCDYDPIARTLTKIYHAASQYDQTVGIISAGTSDFKIVSEVKNTLHFLNINHDVIQDVGVAGIERLLAKETFIRNFDILIVVAGFEGALASVVGGLFPQPVVGVPTSVGYGVSTGGRVAMEAMLASCANGLTVVNIDNGCGAALAAARILNLMNK